MHGKLKCPPYFSVSLQRLLLVSAFCKPPWHVTMIASGLPVQLEWGRLIDAKDGRSVSHPLGFDLQDI